MDIVALCRRPGVDPDAVTDALAGAIEQLDAVAWLAIDRDAPARVRLVALRAVVEAASLRDKPIPEILIEVVDDLAIVEAAVAHGFTDAICAALIKLGPRPDLVSTRRRAVRKLIAQGASGLPLAGLAFDLGDLISGALLASKDYAKYVEPLVGRPAPEPMVRAYLAWLTSLEKDQAVLAVLTAVWPAPKLFDHMKAPAYDRVRRLAEGMLALP
jgi:hypothetical protein